MTAFKTGELVQLYYNGRCNINSVINLYVCSPIDPSNTLLSGEEGEAGMCAIFLEYNDHGGYIAQILANNSIYFVWVQDIVPVKS